jgi:hypothetical protein
MRSMSPDPGTPLGQIRLAAILRYFQHGDFASFRRSCELVFGDNLPSSEYFCPNLLLAAQVGGLCEVSAQRGSTQWWWAAQQGDVKIRSLRPKQIGVSEDWFERHRESVAPVIMGSKGRPLLLGAHLASPENASAAIFATRLDQLAPSFKALEKEICEPVALHDDFPGGVEAYCPESGSWEHSAVDMRRGAQLLKVRREYFGVSFYVQNLPLGLRVRIREPGWAFVVAFFLLAWPVSSLVNVEATTLSFWRAVKLPALLSRLLFANARSLRIDTRIVFEDVHSPCIAGVLDYLTQLGERE